MTAPSCHTDADLEKPLQRRVATPDAGHTHTAQHPFTPEISRFADYGDLVLPYYDFGLDGEDLRHAGPGLARSEVITFEQLQDQYGNPDPSELCRRARENHSPLPYDAAGAELSCDRRGCRRLHDPPPYNRVDAELGSDQRERRLNRSPAPYDVMEEDLLFGPRQHHRTHSLPQYDAGNDGSIFDDDRHDRFYLPRYDVNLGDFDEGSSLQMDLDPPNPQPFPIPDRGRETSADRFDSCGPYLDPRRYEYDIALTRLLHQSHHEVERGGLYTSGHIVTAWPLQLYPEEDYRFSSRGPHRCHKRREPVMNQLKRDLHISNSRFENLQRKWQRVQKTQKAQAKRQNERHARQSQRDRKPRAFSPPRSAAQLSYGDLDNLPHGDHGIPYRPHPAFEQQQPPLGERTFTGRNAQEHPTYFSPNFVQSAHPTQSVLANNANAPPTLANHAAKRTTNDVPPFTHQAPSPINPGYTAHNTTTANSSSTNPNAVPPAQPTLIDVSQSSSPGPSNSNFSPSTSTDSGYLTPDDESEVSGSHDEMEQEKDGGGESEDELLATFLRIEL